VQADVRHRPAILLARQQYGWAMTHIGLHLAGSLFATALGFATMRLLRA
jgi:fluoride ion exporter CrcB/FEX